MVKKETTFLLAKWPGNNRWEIEYENINKKIIELKREQLEQELINANDEETELAILSKSEAEKKLLKKGFGGYKW